MNLSILSRQTICPWIYPPPPPPPPPTSGSVTAKVPFKIYNIIPTASPPPQAHTPRRRPSSACRSTMFNKSFTTFDSGEKQNNHTQSADRFYPRAPVSLAVQTKLIMPDL